MTTVCVTYNVLILNVGCNIEQKCNIVIKNVYV